MTKNISCLQKYLTLQNKVTILLYSTKTPLFQQALTRTVHFERTTKPTNGKKIKNVIKRNNKRKREGIFVYYVHTIYRTTLTYIKISMETPHYYSQ